MRWVLLAAVAVLLAAPAAAQERAASGGDPLERERDRLSTVTSEMKALADRRAALKRESDKLAAAIEETTRAMIAVAARIQAAEETLSAADRRLAALAVELEAKRASLVSRQNDVLKLVGVLQTLARQPPELLLVKPATAVETARTAALLSGILPVLRERTALLRKTVAQLQDIRAQTLAERASQQAALRLLATDQNRMVSLTRARADQRQALLKEASADDARIGDLAEQARDIKELLERLEADERLRVRLAALPGPRPRPERTLEPARQSPAAVALAPPAREPPVRQGGRSFAQARGDILLPVRGDLVQSFGDQTPTGSARGILIRSRADAQIVAPYDGRVAFAGVFRGYGMLLIIAHGQGYHSLIAGMARIDGKVGDQVRAGEPVGVMGGDVAAPDLYLELRQGGSPINPLPWLTAGLRKTQG